MTSAALRDVIFYTCKTLRFQADNLPVAALAAPLASKRTTSQLLARAACFTALAFLDVLCAAFSAAVLQSGQLLFPPPRAQLCLHTVGRVVAWFLGLVPYGLWQWCTSLAQSIGGTGALCACCLLLCILIIYCLAMCSAFCLATLSSCAVQLPTGVTKPLEPQINNGEPHLSLELLPRLNRAFAWSVFSDF